MATTTEDKDELAGRLLREALAVPSDDNKKAAELFERTLRLLGEMPEDIGETLGMSRDDPEGYDRLVTPVWERYLATLR